MNEIFDDIFNRHPFLKFCCESRYAFLSLLENGIVSAGFAIDKHPHQQLMAAMLSNNIRNYYDIGEFGHSILTKCSPLVYGNEIWQNPRKANVFISKKSAGTLMLFNNSFSIDSQGTAILYEIDGKPYALLTFNQASPPYSLSVPEPMAVTDAEGKLCTCNSEFVSNSAKNAIPDSILGTPISKQIDFFYKRSSHKATVPMHKISSDIRNILFSNSDNNLKMIFLKLPVKHGFQDYEITVSLTLVAGSPPLFVLNTPELDPNDSLGYLIGTGINNSSTILKRSNVTIRESPGLKNSNSESVTLTVKVSRNDRIRYFENGRLVLSYYDKSYFVPSSMGLGAGLAIRTGSSFVIQSISAAVSDEYEQTDNPLYAKFRNTPDQTFKIRHFYTSWSGKIRQLWRFDNVSTYEREILNLQIEKASTEKEKERLEKTIRSKKQLNRLVGTSREADRIRESITTLAEHANTLLLIGETGTGKEIMAELYHNLSPRSNGPFIKLDCSSIPSTLVESELFGYEKGAFTGAHRRHHGKFEQAHGGTLFIDEIANISLETQAKLLGVLEDFRITRLGGHSAVKLDVHIVAASNLPIDSLIEKGTFRRDLFYRLNRFSLTLPPLRNRIDDIHLLAMQFLSEANTLYGKNVSKIDEECHLFLREYKWPGNIRELKNTIYKAVLFCKGEVVTRDLVGTVSEADQTISISVTRGKRTRLTKELLVAAAKRHEGNIAALAESLSVTRMTIYKKMRLFGILPDTFRPVSKGK